MEKSLRAEDGLKRKLFTSREIEYCDSKRNGVQNYAARFAAKEAFFKALGTGWRDGLGFCDIEIINDELGKPVCMVHGKAKDLVDSLGISSIVSAPAMVPRISNAFISSIADAILLA